ncbi:MAG: GAF domain-containing protein, partial [Pseudomonadota bacterium]|nr:GAF domain-containing protein [Pseudomonadota bacterium]
LKDLRERQRLLEALGSIQRSISHRAPLQGILDAIVATAAELCGAGSAELHLAEGGTFRLIAAAGATGGDERAAGLAVAESRVVQTAADSRDGAAPGMTLAVPLTLDGKAAGALTLRRDGDDTYSERETELAATLAAQAAIAITTARLAGALEERSRSLDQALSEREATADMLATIGRSRFDLDAVLDRLVHSAAELCGEGMAAICLNDGGTMLESAAGVGFPHGWPGDERYLHTASLARRAMREAGPLQSPGGAGGDTSARNTLAVPLHGSDGAVGALVIARTQPFGDADIAVATTLADQAAIAVETVRLLEAVKSRTAELGEALRQQTAAAGMLNAISRPAADLDGVLAAMAASAAELCGASTSEIYLLKDGAYHLGAAVGSPELLAQARANPVAASRDSWVGRAALDKAVVHMPDLDGHPKATTGVASVLCVPLLREGEAIGVFALTRPRPGPFGERQVELVRTFADQAVMAIENARLAGEVQARTAELDEAARQQQATAEVLKTIGRSRFDLDRVLTTLTGSAATLCNAGGAAIYMLRDGAYRLGAATGAMPEQLVRPHLPGRDSWIGRAALDRTVIHIADTGHDTDHDEIVPIGGVAAILCVPLLREGAAIGVFALTRSEPTPFTARQIELANIFADEAAIATESAQHAQEAQARAEKIAALLEDLHAAQARLGRTERLVSLGRLVPAIGGEIEEQLNAVSDVSALSNRLVDDIRMVLEAAVIDGRTRAEVEELGDTLKANLDKVAWSSRRAGSVVRNTLLNLQEDRDGTPRGSGARRAVDINAVVDESLGLALHGARAEREDFDITLERQFDPLAGKVDLDPQEITRALLNVISNGFHATAMRRAEANGTAYRPVLEASTRNLGGAVEIRIRDNGTGIPAEVKTKMFEPFFTTMPAGEGAGLGLSLSRDIIVGQHSGTIEVETEPGSFTEFRIVLPRDPAATAATATALEGGEAGSDPAQSS